VHDPQHVVVWKLGRVRAPAKDWDGVPTSEPLKVMSWKDMTLVPRRAKLAPLQRAARTAEDRARTNTNHGPPPRWAELD